MALVVRLAPASAVDSAAFRSMFAYLLGAERSVWGG
jgi:hypothetical protein